MPKGRGFTALSGKNLTSYPLSAGSRRSGSPRLQKGRGRGQHLCPARQIRLFADCI